MKNSATVIKQTINKRQKQKQKLKKIKNKNYNNL